MLNKPFIHQAPFPMGEDNTEYCLLTLGHVSIVDFDGETILRVEPEALTLLTRQVFHDASFMLRPAHREQVAAIFHGPKASENDKYVVLRFLRDSEAAAKGVLLTCQDTGTATIIGKKGQRMWTGGGDGETLSKGVYNAYIGDNLRYSQDATLDMYKEVNTGTNLPVQTDLYAVDGDEYKFLCVVEGGDSVDKTCPYQETGALPTPGRLKNFPVEKMRILGTAACLPYHIAFMIDGTSVEINLRVVELASIHYYGGLPTEGDEHDQVFRDVQLEQELLGEAQKLGLGAQFGDKYFAHDIRVIRLPRHGTSYPAGIGVSCSADRNIKTKISCEGIWIEKLGHNPGQYIPQELRQTGEDKAVKVDLNRPMRGILAQLPQYPVPTRLSFTGTIIVGRDIAYTRLKELTDASEEFPQYIKGHLVCYADPAKTPAGYPSGSLSPATAGRMDLYADLLQSHDGSMIILAKGNHNQRVTDACHKHGGFYLGSIGGSAAVLVQQSIKHLECVAYPELSMEATWKIEIEDLPASILVDGKGNDFFRRIVNKQCANRTRQPLQPSAQQHVAR